jgi:hypothetical protein
MPPNPRATANAHRTSICRRYAPSTAATSSSSPRRTRWRCATGSSRTSTFHILRFDNGRAGRAFRRSRPSVGHAAAWRDASSRGHRGSWRESPSREVSSFVGQACGRRYRRVNSNALGGDAGVSEAPPSPAIAPRVCAARREETTRARLGAQASVRSRDCSYRLHGAAGQNARALLCLPDRKSSLRLPRPPLSASRGVRGVGAGRRGGGSGVRGRGW